MAAMRAADWEVAGLEEGLEGEDSNHKCLCSSRLEGCRPGRPPGQYYMNKPHC